MQISRTITLITMTVAALLAHSLVYAASLDVPSNGDTLSGIGIIHGWKCEAEGAITIRFDGGGSIPATYGFPRGDTSQTCGRDNGNNGFYAFYNWAILGDGEHTAVAYDNGVQFASATFTVVTTGEEFLSGVEAQCTIPDFPAPGEEARFIWNESTQHLELAAVSDPSEPIVGGKLYWIARKGGSLQYAVQRANLDGSQLETLFDRGLYPVDLAVDPNRGKLYWTAGNEDLRGIQRANLDGSQVENLVLWHGPNGGAPRELSVDPTGGKLYWLFWRSGSYVVEIQRANLDGSQVETLFSRSDRIFHLAVDPAGGKLYWPDYGPGVGEESVWRANLDGSQVETLFVMDSQLGINFTLDSTGGKLYWTLNPSTRYRRYAVQRANLDGSQIETLFVSDSQPLGRELVVDTTGGKLYWTNYGPGVGEESVWRANLDGSQIEPLFSSSNWLLDLALVLE